MRAGNKKDGESIGGYFLGLGEIILGGTIIAGGFALEVVTVGRFTLGLGVNDRDRSIVDWA